MPMFKKNLKLIATAIGLVTVLVMGLATLGCARSRIRLRQDRLFKSLDNKLATLTALKGILLDVAEFCRHSIQQALGTFLPLFTCITFPQRLLEDGLERNAVTCGPVSWGDGRDRSPELYRIGLKSWCLRDLKLEEGTPVSLPSCGCTVRSAKSCYAP
jgi:hypothetical protein